MAVINLQQQQTSSSPEPPPLNLTWCGTAQPTVPAQRDAAASSHHWQSQLWSPSAFSRTGANGQTWQPLAKLCKAVFLQCMSRWLRAGRSFMQWLRSCHYRLCWQWWKRRGFFRVHLEIKSFPLHLSGPRTFPRLYKFVLLPYDLQLLIRYIILYTLWKLHLLH